MLLNSENAVESENFNYYIDNVTEKYQFVGFICGIVYLIVVFLIRYWMKTRSKFALKNFAVRWNVSLLVLNFVATVGLLPTLVDILIHGNFYASLCTDR